MNQDLSALSDEELNAICYVEVFGMTYLGGIDNRPCWRRPEGGKVVQDPPDYCNSPAAFWEVVEKVGLSIQRYVGGDGSVAWQARRLVTVHDPCASPWCVKPGRAIVIAAITAVRKEKQA